MGMAMHLASLLLLLLSISTVADAVDDDAVALLAFKAAAVGGDGGYALPSSTGGFCSWEGVTCQGQPRRVVALSLPSRGLNGVLSPAVGNLSSLTVLDLGSNRLSGAVPASLGRLRRLETLNLSSNVFSGEIPANLSSCTSLASIGLQSNQLRGRLPPELGDKLTRLRSSGCGRPTSPVPSRRRWPTCHRSVKCPSHSTSSRAPPSLLASAAFRASDTLTAPSTASPFTGTIPESLSNLTALKLLDFTDNRFSGHVPPTLGRLPALQRLLLAINRLQADDSEGWEFITSLSNCSQLQTLLINDNPGLSGQLPSSIGNLSVTLQHLYLNSIGINGSIPTSIGNLVGLEFLSVANTSISGAVPDSIGKLGKLTQLDFYNTHLSGSIPSSIGNLTGLISLYAYSASFDGVIPASLGKLKNLMALDLSNNHLNGSIPREIFRLPLLSRFLDLSHNSLTGQLPSEVGSMVPDSIGRCTVLEQLMLDNNSFEGRIPQSLENLKGLRVLNLSMNMLSGNIPDAIGSIRDLQQLSLAHNYLTGIIPTVLQNLSLLSKLDLSFNNLQGEVPQKGIFKSLTNLSITANDELCGGIQQLHLAPCHEKSSGNKNRKGQSLAIALAATGVLIFLVFATVFSCLLYKKIGRKQNKPILRSITEEHYERVTYHTLANPLGPDAAIAIDAELAGAGVGAGHSMAGAGAGAAATGDATANPAVVPPLAAPSSPHHAGARSGRGQSWGWPPSSLWIRPRLTTAAATRTSSSPSSLSHQTRVVPVGARRAVDRRMKTKRSPTTATPQPTLMSFVARQCWCLHPRCAPRLIQP
ncbi:hypothetical protein C2845_PM11G03990 [Panicum miliaceum]|uniref:non-specific serine/threonine protein kinase n=1 Tax=Panicum miliaceum TaxID=4540 RepID=A0A3L6RVK4_PANMI|nr:hypothetical protein C2845_PM11G03990 [Panicum miliaceum]